MASWIGLGNRHALFSIIFCLGLIMYGYDAEAASKGDTPVDNKQGLLRTDAPQIGSFRIDRSKRRIGVMFNILHAIEWTDAKYMKIYEAWQPRIHDRLIVSTYRYLSNWWDGKSNIPYHDLEKLYHKVYEKFLGKDAVRYIRVTGLQFAKQ